MILIAREKWQSLARRVVRGEATQHRTRPVVDVVEYINAAWR